MKLILTNKEIEGFENLAKLSRDSFTVIEELVDNKMGKDKAKFKEFKSQITNETGKWGSVRKTKDGSEFELKEKCVTDLIRISEILLTKYISVIESVMTMIITLSGLSIKMFDEFNSLWDTKTEHYISLAHMGECSLDSEDWAFDKISHDFMESLNLSATQAWKLVSKREDTFYLFREENAMYLFKVKMSGEEQVLEHKRSFTYSDSFKDKEISMEEITQILTDMGIIKK
jgi:hypothetical protein